MRFQLREELHVQFRSFAIATLRASLLVSKYRLSPLLGEMGL